MGRQLGVSEHDDPSASSDVSSLNSKTSLALPYKVLVYKLEATELVLRGKDPDSEDYQRLAEKKAQYMAALQDTDEYKERKMRLESDGNYENADDAIMKELLPDENFEKLLGSERAKLKRQEEHNAKVKANSFSKRQAKGGDTNSKPTYSFAVLKQKLQAVDKMLKQKDPENDFKEYNKLLKKRTEYVTALEETEEYQKEQRQKQRLQEKQKAWKEKLRKQEEEAKLTEQKKLESADLAKQKLEDLQLKAKWEQEARLDYMEEQKRKIEEMERLIREEQQKAQEQEQEKEEKKKQEQQERLEEKQKAWKEKVRKQEEEVKMAEQKKQERAELARKELEDRQKKAKWEQEARLDYMEEQKRKIEEMERLVREEQEKEEQEKREQKQQLEEKQHAWKEQQRKQEEEAEVAEQKRKEREDLARREEEEREEKAKWEEEARLEYMEEQNRKIEEMERLVKEEQEKEEQKKQAKPPQYTYKQLVKKMELVEDMMKKNEDDREGKVYKKLVLKKKEYMAAMEQTEEYQAKKKRDERKKALQEEAAQKKREALAARAQLARKAHDDHKVQKQLEEQRRAEKLAESKRQIEEMERKIREAEEKATEKQATEKQKVEEGRKNATEEKPESAPPSRYPYSVLVKKLESVEAMMEKLKHNRRNPTYKKLILKKKEYKAAMEQTDEHKEKLRLKHAAAVKNVGNAKELDDAKKMLEETERLLVEEHERVAQEEVKRKEEEAKLRRKEQEGIDEKAKLAAAVRAEKVLAKAAAKKEAEIQRVAEGKSKYSYEQLKRKLEIVDEMMKKKSTTNRDFKRLELKRKEYVAAIEQTDEYKALQNKQDDATKESGQVGEEAKGTNEAEETAASVKRSRAIASVAAKLRAKGLSEAKAQQQAEAIVEKRSNQKSQTQSKGQSGAPSSEEAKEQPGEPKREEAGTAAAYSYEVLKRKLQKAEAALLQLLETHGRDSRAYQIYENKRLEYLSKLQMTEEWKQREQQKKEEQQQKKEQQQEQQQNEAKLKESSSLQKNSEKRPAGPKKLERTRSKRNLKPSQMNVDIAAALAMQRKTPEKQPATKERDARKEEGVDGGEGTKSDGKLLDQELETSEKKGVTEKGSKNWKKTVVREVAKAQAEKKEKEEIERKNRKEAMAKAPTKKNWEKSRKRKEEEARHAAMKRQAEEVERLRAEKSYVEAEQRRAVVYGSVREEEDAKLENAVKVRVTEVAARKRAKLLNETTPIRRESKRFSTSIEPYQLPFDAVDIDEEEFSEHEGEDIHQTIGRRSDKKVDALKHRLDSMMNRLQAIEEQKAENAIKKAYEVKGHQAKFDLEKTFQEAFNITPEVKNKKKELTPEERLVRDQQDLIQQLRNENRVIREEEMATIEHLTKQQKVQRKNLTEVARKTEEAIQGVKKHLSNIESVNEALNKQISVYEEKFSKAKDDYQKRFLFYLSEAHCRDVYEAAIHEIVPHVMKRADLVRKRRDNKAHESDSDDSTIVDDDVSVVEANVLHIAKDGLDEAKRLADAALAQAGLTAIPRELLSKSRARERTKIILRMAESSLNEGGDDDEFWSSSEDGDSDDDSSDEDTIRRKRKKTRAKPTLDFASIWEHKFGKANLSEPEDQPVGEFAIPSVTEDALGSESEDEEEDDGGAFDFFVRNPSKPSAPQKDPQQPKKEKKNEKNNNSKKQQEEEEEEVEEEIVEEIVEEEEVEYYYDGEYYHYDDGYIYDDEGNCVGKDGYFYEDEEEYYYEHEEGDQGGDKYLDREGIVSMASESNYDLSTDDEVSRDFNYPTIAISKSDNAPVSDIEYEDVDDDSSSSDSFVPFENAIPAIQIPQVHEEAQLPASEPNDGTSRGSVVAIDFLDGDDAYAAADLKFERNFSDLQDKGKDQETGAQAEARTVPQQAHGKDGEDDDSLVSSESSGWDSDSDVDAKVARDLRNSGLAGPSTRYTYRDTRVNDDSVVSSDSDSLVSN